MSCNSTDVAERIGIASPYVTQCVGPIEGLATGLEVDAGVCILHVPWHADVDATDTVDDRGEAAKTDLDVTIDAHPGDLLDGLHEQFGSAYREGGVDLVVAMTGNGHITVTRK